MDANDLKTLQAPIKDRYRQDPTAARYHAEGGRRNRRRS